MCSSFLTLSMGTTKAKEIDISLINWDGWDSSWEPSQKLSLSLACFCGAPIKVHKTGFLAERNHAYRTVKEEQHYFL